MVVLGKSFICNNKCKIPYHFLTGIGKKSTTISAKKGDFPQNLDQTQKKPIFEFKISNKVLAQSAIVVLGLGFVDAGYSGDWSRIGVISKESEEVLKIAAFVVVPFCLFLIFSLSKDRQN